MATPISDRIIKGFYSGLQNRQAAEQNYNNAYIQGINAQNSINTNARAEDLYWDYQKPLNKSNLDVTLPQNSILAGIFNDPTYRKNVHNTSLTNADINNLNAIANREAQPYLATTVKNNAEMGAMTSTNSVRQTPTILKQGNIMRDTLFGVNMHLAQEAMNPGGTPSTGTPPTGTPPTGTGGNPSGEALVDLQKSSGNGVPDAGTGGKTLLSGTQPTQETARATAIADARAKLTALETELAQVVENMAALAKIGSPEAMNQRGILNRRRMGIFGERDRLLKIVATGSGSLWQTWQQSRLPTNEEIQLQQLARKGLGGK